MLLNIAASLELRTCSTHLMVRLINPCSTLPKTLNQTPFLQAFCRSRTSFRLESSSKSSSCHSLRIFCAKRFYPSFGSQTLPCCWILNSTSFCKGFESSPLISKPLSRNKDYIGRDLHFCSQPLMNSCLWTIAVSSVTMAKSGRIRNGGNSGIIG